MTTQPDREQGASPEVTYCPSCKYAQDEKGRCRMSLCDLYVKVKETRHD